VAYQANRDGSQIDKNVDAERVHMAAKVLKKSPNPYVRAAGITADVAHKVTGGRSSKFIASKMPKDLSGGQDLGKKLRDAASLRGFQSVPKSSNNSEDKQDDKSPASSRSSKDSSKGSSNDSSKGSSNDSSIDNKKDKDKKDKDKDKKEDNPAKGVLSFLGKAALFKVIIALGVLLIFAIIICLIVSAFSGVLGDFNDAIGINTVLGGETGNVNFSPADKAQQDFYERVNKVKLSFQSQGKNVDPLKIVAVFHVLKKNKANIDYSTITSSQIEEVANSMFLNNQYDETIFKYNLKNTIIPKYLPNSSTDIIINEIFKYVSDYNDLVGATDVNANSNSSSSSNCVSTDTCTYSLKGFSIPGKGNISENLNISNLYVRLMQCGIGNGHNYGGTFGKALENEELVPFEKYILGVAYHKYESGTPSEAIKAQMVADRSFILARHADLGGWRTLKKENGRWILQAASCTQDRVYCDPDKGCSSNDVEWGMVHSGLNNASGYSKQPLSELSPLRSLAKEVAGEVLANKGYVVYTNSNSNDWNKFVSLANKGYNYKQILMEVYNQGNRNYGVSTLLKGSCSKTTSCQASGDYASWRQNEGPWVNVKLGSSGKTIKQIGCLATSVAILIAKSGVQTNVTPFNPGTFVEAMSKVGGFGSSGDMMYGPVSFVAPNFRYVGSQNVLIYPEQMKLNKLINLLNSGYYVVAEVKGNTGQHWVAIDSVQNGVINMMDPGTNYTNMWKAYPSRNTSRFVYFKAN